MFGTRSNEEINRPLKVCLIGDASVGKTSFYKRLISLINGNKNYKFNKNYESTEDFNIEKLIFKTNLGNIQIFLYDTRGQEQISGTDLRDGYLIGSNSVIILYDVTNKRTLDNLQKWIDNVKRTCSPNTPIAVCGNKIDKEPNIKNNENVKMRDARLRPMYNNNIKGFLISVKENREFIEGGDSSFFSAKDKNINSILGPFEYILSKHFNREVKIDLSEASKNVTSNDDF
jgi:small GTP-binding protein